MYKKHISTKYGIPEKNVVYEPSLRPIKSGAFSSITDFTKTKVFAQIIYFALLYGLTYKDHVPDIPDTRIDSFMHAVLYLAQIAVAEEKNWLSV